MQNGFANFEDINNIAYGVLKKDKGLAKLITARFPMIFVDECQDLSWIEINILDALSKSGAILHFIVDLNQSIYEFKYANPEYTQNFVSKFNKFQLTDNFRSCHTIVETANLVSSIKSTVKGCAINLFKDKSVCYLEYNDVSILKNQYLNFLNQVGISPKKASILVRQQDLKDKIDKKDRQSPHLLIDALQLWNTNIPSNQLLALELTGKQLQKWFGGSNTKKNYYCPNSITSVYRWRVFLKDYLETLITYPSLLDFSNKTYSQWYNMLNKYSSALIQGPYKSLSKFDNEERNFSEFPNYRTPNGTAKQKISEYSSVKNIEYPLTNTIHSVKRKDFDGVMVVSSQRNSGSGHWKQWIKNEGEAKRIGYVANTRSKYSLIWAVPTLNKEDKEKIESY
ncbi:ATP-dependent helicase, partial [Bacillus sp. MM2020_1]|nr:ATP-dependent helicase [Bacillus sp. MM2020_1]